MSDVWIQVRGFGMREAAVLAESTAADVLEQFGRDVATIHPISCRIAAPAGSVEGARTCDCPADRIRWHPHDPHGEKWDGTQWQDCGTTSDRWPCMAWSLASDRQCPKNAAVRLPAAYVVPGPSPETFHVQVCGGHFDVHRLGKPLGILV